MDELFVPYQLALKLQSKGFDEVCIRFYNGQKNLGAINESGQTPAPLFQQVVDWFRDLHNVHIYIKHNRANGKFHFFIEHEQGTEHGISYPLYYQALTEGVEKALEFVR